MKATTSSRSYKSKYKDIYNLIAAAWFTSDYVRELHQFDPIKYTIKVSNGTTSKRFYSVSIICLWIDVSEYIKDQASLSEIV